jgi:micrococcal nuclease
VASRYGRAVARTRAALATAVAALVAAAAAGWWLGGAAAAVTVVTVVDVVDGDTVVVARRDGERDTVRLLGVDTPETRDPDAPVQCFGPEATAFTRAALLGRRVQLELDTEARDRYGRLLAYVHVDGRRFNDRLLAEGYARLLVIAPNLRHGRALLAAELAARTERRGLWSACTPG